MKKILTTTMAGLFVFGALSSSAALADVESLRGVTSLDSDATMFERKKQVKAEGGFERAWELQPPAIPHAIEKDRITLRENTCMKCHSKASFEKEKAPKAGDSHYVTRDGETLEKLSSRRYFCSQCHVLQLDVQPLVENTFQVLPWK